MHLAAIDWLSISINLLLVVFVIVCLLMTLLVLMQRPKQEGLGAAFGGGVTDQVFGARTTNVLQRGTVYLASLFFLLSLVLAVLIGHQNKKVSMLKEKTKTEEVKKEEEKPATPAEAQPKSLLEELPAGTPAVPAEPVTPPVAPPAQPATPPVTPPAEPVTPPAEPVTPPAEPVTPPAEPVTPPAESVTAPAETATPPADPAPEEKSGQP
jgi:preprotein translocase subunit SecG